MAGHPMLALAAATVVAACGAASSPTGSGGPPVATPVAVVVTLTDAGCIADPASVPAGPVTFTVTNTSGTAVTEVELVSNGTVVGEKEDLTPGLTGAFSVALEAGAYVLRCPGAAAPQTAFDVTAAGPATGPPATSPAASDGSP